MALIRSAVGMIVGFYIGASLTYLSIRERAMTPFIETYFFGPPAEELGTMGLLQRRVSGGYIWGDYTERNYHWHSWSFQWNAIFKSNKDEERAAMVWIVEEKYRLKILSILAMNGNTDMQKKKRDAVSDKMIWYNHGTITKSKHRDGHIIWTTSFTPYYNQLKYIFRNSTWM